MTADFIRRAPKVELHVHLEGSVRPSTLLQLAQKNKIELPATSVAEMAEWFRFRDFAHFVQVYLAASSCIRDSENLELVAREFLQGQADQNILYSEPTLTMWTLRKQSGIPLDEQLAAVNRARAWAKDSLNVDMRLVVDIVREESVEDGLAISRWAIENRHNGICALGLSGVESEAEPKKHEVAFGMALESGLSATCHAGETAGAWSIRNVVDDLHAARVGHGVRCLEDPELVKDLRDRNIHLEVCPSSNVCLGVSPSLAEHPLPRLLNEGLNVSVNSDDPAMFGSTLTDELIVCSKAFGFNEDVLWTLTQNAARASFLGEEEKRELMRRLREGFSELFQDSSTSEEGGA